MPQRRSVISHGPPVDALEIQGLGCSQSYIMSADALELPVAILAAGCDVIHLGGTRASRVPSGRAGWIEARGVAVSSAGELRITKSRRIGAGARSTPAEPQRPHDPSSYHAFFSRGSDRREITKWSRAQTRWVPHVLFYVGASRLRHARVQSAACGECS